MKVTYTIYVDDVKIATIGCQDRKWGKMMLRHFCNETAALYPKARNIKVERMDLGARLPAQRYAVLVDGPPAAQTEGDR
jgi:hypothetical protein